ncbi:hypothetical protein J7428_16970, partial [Xanthomonas phaseoli pv. manihotis]
ASTDEQDRLLTSGSSWSVVQKTVGCSRSTISQAVKHAKLSAPAPAPSTELMAAASVAVILWLHVENGSKFRQCSRLLIFRAVVF